ncbi:DUF4184 family protein [Bacillus infantis]|uniref:DUF4184 family protein n=1 Tax=Bacillus infantis TaxID=324767 RepID=UPI003CE7CDDF
MPLTFAHPAAVLVFSRKSKYINFSAMVLGSMAPDFEYFLRGRPAGEIGHELPGFFFFNLPLAALLYFIYHTFIHRPLMDHLPWFLQDTFRYKNDGGFGLRFIVFCYSALFGMFTHIAWDAFTHANGLMVRTLPYLSRSITFFDVSVPLYKFLQHGSTLCGILIILGYLFYRANAYDRTRNVQISPLQKLAFWSSTSVTACAVFFFWHLIDHLSINSYGVIVVRLIDSFLIGILVISIKEDLIERAKSAAAES